MAISTFDNGDHALFVKKRFNFNSNIINGKYIYLVS